MKSHCVACSNRSWLRSLRNTLLATCAALAVTPTASIAQNLVLNPGFETTSSACAAANWTSVGNCGSNYVFAAATAHSGTQSLEIGEFFLGPVNISQTVATVAGKYSFSFWYDVYSPGPGASFNASVGSHTFNLSAATATSYIQFTQQVTLPAGATTVAFATASGTFWRWQSMTSA
jgi:hypothetical protein